MVNIVRLTQTLEEVWLEVNLKDIPTKALHGVIEGKYMYTLAVLDVKTLVHVDEIAEFYPQVVTSDFVHLDSALLDVIRAQADEDCVSPFLPSELAAV
jgi:hypothetical protein